MVSDVEWSIIELTQIYEAFDTALELLDEDIERIYNLILDAECRGATLYSMTKPIEPYAEKLQILCETAKQLEDEKNNKNQNT